MRKEVVGLPGSSSTADAATQGPCPALPLGPITFEELRQRVADATGPDHWLDAHVMCLLHGYTMHEESDPNRGVFAFWSREPWNSMCHNSTSWGCPTEDLQMLLDAMPVRLPGWSVCLSITEHGGHCNAVIGRSHPTNKVIAYDHHTLPLALLSCILDALANAQTSSDGAGNGTASALGPTGTDPGMHPSNQAKDEG